MAMQKTRREAKSEMWSPTVSLEEDDEVSTTLWIRKILVREIRSRYSVCEL